MRRGVTATLLLFSALLCNQATAQSCAIEQTSERTGTTMSIDLQTGCTDAARETFGAAALYWADFLYSPVPITVTANFEPLTCNASGGTLGSAGPRTAARNFFGAPQASTWYAAALANSLSGEDLRSEITDINMRYNNAIGTPGCLEYTSGWYFDDGSAPTTPSGYIDLYGTIQHEISHGLGFLSLYSSDGVPYDNSTDAYSRLLLDETTGTLIDNLSSDGSRKAAFTSQGNLTWSGSAVDGAANTLTDGTTNGNARMYAPNPWQNGSSVSHFDTVLSPNDLMEPMKNSRAGTTFHLSRNLMRDIGWKTLPDPPVIALSAVTSESLRLSVTPPAQLGGAALLSYTVTCGSTSVTTASTTVTVSSLSPGTEYDCYGFSTTALGTSDPSNLIRQATSRTPVVYISSVTSDIEKLTFQIGITSDGGAGIDQYSVSCTDGDTTYTASSPSNTVILTGLSSDKSYSCTAAATNSVGTGPDSAASTGLTPDSSATGLPVWLLYQATQRDSDGDRLLDRYETNTGTFVSATNTGTDPNKADTDGDGISDGDEVLGTTAGLDLPGMGVSPLKKTILLEYDWLSDDTQEWYDPVAEDYVNTPHNHRPTAAIAGWVEETFANAPVTNPDGTTGIQLIQDYGQGGLFTGGNEIADDDGNISSDEQYSPFGTFFKDTRATHFAANREGYFHYTLFAHRYMWDFEFSDSSGYAELPGDDLIVTTDNWFAYFPDSVASTIVHELGHNLNLQHGGDVGTNWKPNYNSVMNYNFQFSGIDTNCQGCGADCSDQNSSFIAGDPIADTSLPGSVRARIDYSRGLRATLNEAALSETTGVCSANPVDWNRNGSIDTSVAAASINKDDIATEVLSDYNDWANIYYGGPADAIGGGSALRSEAVACHNAPPPIK